jgi:NTP pyrophosphatase (non-canonical NTP hydrolase)
VSVSRLHEEAVRIYLQSGVFRSIALERKRQDDKWGIQNHDPLVWFAIAGEEFGEVAKALVQRESVQMLRAELVQLAAVVVAFIESLDRNELALSDDMSDEEWYRGQEALWQYRRDSDTDFARRMADST